MKGHQSETKQVHITDSSTISCWEVMTVFILERLPTLFKSKIVQFFLKPRVTGQLFVISLTKISGPRCKREYHKLYSSSGDNLPELPEVETIASGLHIEFSGKILEEIQVTDPELLRNVDQQKLEQALTGRELERVSRRGKYVLLEFTSSNIVAIHLRMSGRLLSLKPGQQTDHERISFHFQNYTNKLTMDNVRRLGTLDLVESRDDEPLDSLGLEPFSDDYNWENFRKIFSTQRPVKVLLLDQSRITGLGNIYASEILFRAKIDPTLPGEEVEESAQKKLFKLIPKVLTEAINHNGTTLNDYQNSDGEEGSFQDFLRIYGKDGEACPNCGAEIVKIEQGGRSTYLCQDCQGWDSD